MPAIRQDLAYAMRSMCKQPGFAAIAVAMLALGIGANVAIFALVNAVLLKPLPFSDPDRLMIVHMLAPDREAPGVFRRMIWSWPKYEVFRDNQRAFESTTVFFDFNWNLTGSGSPERVSGELVESTYFHVLGLTPHLGRTFTAEETRAPGSVPLAVLSHGFWVRRYGGDGAVIGETIGLNGVPHTIVGVMPAAFKGLTGLADVWVPVTTLSAADLGEAWNHSYRLIARRKADVSADQADAAARVLGARVHDQYPDPGRRGTAWSATAVPLNDERVNPLIRRSVLLLLAAVGVLLLIVCINLANLMLVRGLARQREVAIRLALGASRLRIVRQFMTESALLAFAGAIAGCGVAYLAVSKGARLLPDLRMVLADGPSAGLTRVGLGHIGLDVVTVLFAIVVTSGTTAMFGLGPAWRASRRDLTETMKAGSSGPVSQGNRVVSLRSVLIVGEIALALVLLTAGGLMIKSVARLQATGLGFTPDRLLAVRVALPGPQYDRQSATQFLERLLERLEPQTAIDAVAYGSCAPVSGGCNVTMATFPDRPPVSSGRNPPVGVMWASPRFFETLGIRLVRGRLFDERDRAGQPKIVVINEAAARTFWGKTEDALGKRIGLGQGGFGDGAEIVGIVADVRYGAVETSVTPGVYLPLLQSTRTSGYIFVRSGAALDSLVPALRREVQALDPDLPLTDVKMMRERFGDATWRTRMSAVLLGVFSAMALFLAALGVYGVMSQGVAQRTREIGVRMALGADRANILRLIISRVCVIALAGVALGMILAVPAMGMLSALLYQVKPGDPFVFATLAMMLLAVAILAGYLPARRATRVNPLTTLRAE